MAGMGMVRGDRSQAYHRRRPLPAVVLVVVLAVAATIVWLRVLHPGSNSTAITCDPPGSPPTAVSGQPPTTFGQPLANDALDRTPPLPPAQSQIRVVNASTQRGLAAEITEALRQLGFGQITPPANDPLYTSYDLSCRAEIRFGQQGMSAARTLSLAEPCAELIKDNRQDASVDLALGKKFDNLRLKPNTRQLLEELNQWALQHPEAQGGLQANPVAQPDIDPAQLAAARQVSCA